jgi:hypothetical protein
MISYQFWDVTDGRMGAGSLVSLHGDGRSAMNKDICEGYSYF